MALTVIHRPLFTLVIPTGYDEGLKVMFALGLSLEHLRKLLGHVYTEHEDEEQRKKNEKDQKG